MSSSLRVTAEHCCYGGFGEVTHTDKCLEMAAALIAARSDVETKVSLNEIPREAVSDFLKDTEFIAKLLQSCHSSLFILGEEYLRQYDEWKKEGS